MSEPRKQLQHVQTVRIHVPLREEVPRTTVRAVLVAVSIMLLRLLISVRMQPVDAIALSIHRDQHVAIQLTAVEVPAVVLPVEASPAVVAHPVHREVVAVLVQEAAHVEAEDNGMLNRKEIVL